MKQPDESLIHLYWEERAHIESIFQEHYPRLFPLVLCGFRSGMRIGELIGLQRQDIDFFNKTIFVQRNVIRRKTATTKSKSSKRMVRMTSMLASVLQQHKTRMKAEMIKKGWEKLPECIFYNEEGGAS